MTCSTPGTPATAVIPVRYGSMRFEGKPLADKTGQPLIQHVVEQVARARSIADIIVATDDQRIVSAVESFGAKVVLTRPDHPNGTSRIAQVVHDLQTQVSGLIVNVQGDEPEIDPGVIDELVAGLVADPDAPMATLASEFADDEDPSDHNIVKVIMDQHNRAIYFSRSLIPYDRDGCGIRPLRHPGVYAYRRDFLLTYVKLQPTPLEQIEQLEQLRAIEHGYKITVIKTRVHHHGIDTPQQYDAFVKRWRSEHMHPT